METLLLMSLAVLWLIVLVNLVLTFALIRKVNASNARTDTASRVGGLEPGSEAPDFTVQTLTGETVTRATYAGRSVAFLFVSAQCQPCRTLLPEIVPLASGAAHAGVDLVLVSRSDQEATRGFIEEMQIHLPVLIAPYDSNPFLKDYQARATPSYCLINEKGKVQSAGYPKGGDWDTLAKSWSRQGQALPA